MIIIYVTFSDAHEAESIAARLLEAGLVACANIFSPHTALYVWQGERKAHTEVSAIFKTVPEQFEPVRDMIRQYHSYETPCIVSWPVGQADTAFDAWVKTASGGA